MIPVAAFVVITVCSCVVVSIIVPLPAARPGERAEDARHMVGGGREGGGEAIAIRERASSTQPHTGHSGLKATLTELTTLTGARRVWCVRS